MLLYSLGIAESCLNVGEILAAFRKSGACSEPASHGNGPVWSDHRLLEMIGFEFVEDPFEAIDGLFAGADRKGAGE